MRRIARAFVASTVCDSRATIPPRPRSHRSVRAWAGVRNLAAICGRCFGPTPPAVPDVWMEQAYVRLRSGDVAGYRQLCTRLVERFGSDKNGQHIVVWTCELGPDSLA